ncbi:TRAP transporter small permease [Desulfopila aestuarii]|uniref:TRAP-type C4-dicarboxylate transport system, small permease component n=1 Tax=Desulfopila aestuarii DSM 18488 TaxID=1121416 RepID=A0A1M7XX77_9BACT|nr:TRAP transporter small permease [Desulfopila aestuarii]SHO43237.1 TRAP-type C4-dicarboxylate transport system, small permease component [Desulfopila aestuarii DSM 18488]
MTKPKRSSLAQKGARFEELVLCLLLGFMIVLACVQIALRTFFGGGLLWADPLLRYLVLWSGLLGASMATSRGEHIALDLAGYLLPEKLQPLVQLACHLFALITSGFLTWASILFIQSEIEYGSPGLLDIPTWGWNMIFPLAFLLITLRYLALVFTTTTTILQGHKSTTGVRQ